MTRTASQTRSTRQLKVKTKDTKTLKPLETTTKTKEGWEMSARDALLVNFVVSEI